MWSVCTPATDISWDAQSERTQFAWATRVLLSDRTAYPELSIVGRPPEAEFVETSKAWIAHPRILLHPSNSSLNPASEEFLISFFSTAAAIRHYSGRPVIPISLGAGANFDEKLMKWATATRRYIDPRFSNLSVASAIEAVSRSGSFGLAEELLQLSDVVLLLSQPPDASHIWKALERAAPTVTVIVISNTRPQNHSKWKEDWFMHTAENGYETPPSQSNFVDKFVSEVPRAAAILALLNRPAFVEKVAEVADEPFQAISKYNSLFLKVGARRTLGEFARSRVLAKLTREELKRGHEGCLDYMASLPQSLSPRARVEVVKNFLGAKKPVEAANFAMLTSDTERGKFETSELLELAELVSSSSDFREAISEGLLLEITEACLGVQGVALARGLLEAKLFRTPINRARAQAQLSEALKADTHSSQSRHRMLRAAKNALQIAEDAASDSPTISTNQAVLAFRQNLARLYHYFEHRFDDAITEYLEVIDSTRDRAFSDATDAQIFCAASRNLGECLFEKQENGGGQLHLEEAENHFIEGIDVANRHGLDAVQAEIYYSYARLDEILGNNAGAIAHLTTALDLAARSMYPVLEWIARDRREWLKQTTGDVSFSLPSVLRRIEALDLLSAHSWAARVSIKCRLKAARHLQKSGQRRDKESAVELLRSNLELFRVRPGMQGRRDKFRYALTYSGLQFLEKPDDDQSWVEFKQLAWAESWIAEHGAKDPSAFWIENEV